MTDADIAPAADILDTPTLLGGDAPAPAPAADAPGDGTLLDPAKADAPPADKKDGEGDDAKPEPKAPEKYEIALDDGQALDADAMEVVEPILRELDLDNDQANALAKAWPQLQGKLAERFAAKHVEAQTAEVARLSKEWTDQSVADTEIGGAPEVMQPKLAKAAAAAERFASPELRQLLNDTRLGNHPEVIRLFYRIGEQISEQAPVRGDAASAPRKTDAEIMYPTMAKAGG